jgi:hypothetical protein
VLPVDASSSSRLSAFAGRHQSRLRRRRALSRRGRACLRVGRGHRELGGRLEILRYLRRGACARGHRSIPQRVAHAANRPQKSPLAVRARRRAPATIPFVERFRCSARGGTCSRRRRRRRRRSDPKSLRVHHWPKRARECTRRDLNPHTLRYRNLNPVGVYPNAARCSQSGVSEGGSLPLASFRYTPWTIQGRFDPLQACCPPTSAARRARL